MPSASNLLLASSNAQVCILYPEQSAPAPRKLPMPRHSKKFLSSYNFFSCSPQFVSILPSKPPHDIFCIAFSSKTKFHTYEVSGLYAYATTPNIMLPQNPYTHVFSHPSSLYFSPGGTPNSHPDGGSKWLSWDAVSGDGCSLTSGGCVEACVRCCWWRYMGPRRRVEFWRD